MYAGIDDHYLAHHGVLGMKWGVRNAETLARYSRDRHQSMSDRDYNKLIRNAVKAETRKHSDRHLTDEQKKALKIAIGAAAVAAVATVSVVALSRNPALVKNFTREIDPSGFAKKLKDSTPEADLKAVNYGYGVFEGRSNNCVLCSMAYDLRRRGFDVRAGSSVRGFDQYKFAEDLYSRPGGLEKGCIVASDDLMHLSRDGVPKLSDFTKPVEDKYKSGVSSLDELFKKQRELNEATSAYGKALREYKDARLSASLKPSPERIEKTLLAQGEGARGAIGISLKPFGGHSIVYEVRDGKVLFPDAQTGKYHDLNKLMRRMSDKAEVEFVRYDNAEPNLERLKSLNYIQNTLMGEAAAIYQKRQK